MGGGGGGGEEVGGGGGSGGEEVGGAINLDFNSCFLSMHSYKIQSIYLRLTKV